MPYEFNPFTNNLDLTKNIPSPIEVDDGGTGETSLTPYAILCGGTTSTGAIQSIASVGSSGQVLKSNGDSALPTFQDAAGGGGYLPSPMFNDSSVYYPLRGVNTTSYGLTSDRLELIPFMVNRNMTITSIGSFFTAAQAGASTRYGLYSQNPSTAAFTLVSDYGTVDNSTTGLKLISISETLSSDIIYWFACVCDENGGAVSMQGNGSLSPAYMLSTTTGQTVRGIYKSSVGAGALASSYAFSDFTLNTGSTANVAVKGLYD